MNAFELKSALDSNTDEEFKKMTVCVVRDTDHEDDILATDKIKLDFDTTELVINI